MHRADFETLGDLHKKYESRHPPERLMPGLPVVARLDGRSFHTFTRGMDRPFDANLAKSMLETAKYLVDQTQATMGYRQSDEITLIWANQDVTKSLLFDGRTQKLLSTLAAMSSVKFNEQVAINLPEYSSRLPVFDCRVMQYPTQELAASNLAWREADATRNSLTMLAHAHYSTKELHKAGFTQKHDMLHAKGINWAHMPDVFKRGVYVRRAKFLKTLTVAELASIPVSRRPIGPVERSIVQELVMPPVPQIVNWIEVVFEGAEPVLATADSN